MVGLHQASKTLDASRNRVAMVQQMPQTLNTSNFNALHKNQNIVLHLNRKRYMSCVYRWRANDDGLNLVIFLVEARWKNIYRV